MTAHLYTKAPPPWEYIELILCRDVYRCTPLELEDIPLDKVMAHLVCMNIEARWQREKQEQAN